MNLNFECWDDAVVEPAVEVAILYADETSKCRAEVFIDGVSAPSAGRARLRVGCWRTDMLVLAEAVGTRFHEIEGSELLILAISMDCRLPAAVLRGVLRWARNRTGHPTALVVVWRISDDSAWPPLMLEGLRRLVHRQGIELISEWGLQPSRESERCIGRLHQRLAFLAGNPNALPPRESY